MSETEYNREDDLWARYKAVRWHTGEGPEAVAMLCRALEDPHPDVRTAAAERLARVGTSEATEPLMRALRRSTGGRWAVLTITGSSFLLIPLGLALLGAAMRSLLVGNSLVSWILFFIVLSILAKAAGKARRQREDLLAAISEALAAIAERAPSPVARAAIRELKVLAADVVQQQSECRWACVKAAERIDRATRDLQRLPVASQEPAATADRLPRPAEAPQMEDRQLPLVRD